MLTPDSPNSGVQSGHLFVAYEVDIESGAIVITGAADSLEKLLLPSVVHWHFDGVNKWSKFSGAEWQYVVRVPVL